MESTMVKVKCLLGILCLVFVSNINLVSATESHGLLSRLYKSAAKRNQPLILVLDNSNIPARDSNTYKTYRGQHSSELDTNDKFIYLNNYLQHAQKKASPKKTKYNRNEPDYYKTKTSDMIYPQYSRDKYNHHDRNEHDRKDRLDGYSSRDSYGYRDRHDKKEIWDRDLMRSPILQNLLKISEQLLRNGECGDNEECKNLETNNDCDGDKDECASIEKSDECNSNSNSCDEDVQRSTKGELVVTEKNKCPRC